MDTPRSLAIWALEQLTRAMREMSDEDFARLVKGELPAAMLSSTLAPRTSGRRPRLTSMSEDNFRDVYSTLSAAASREEGQRIVGEVFQKKEDLFSFAKFLDLPVQRRDTVDRIRDKIITYTVGRRLSGEAVRGSYGKE